MVISLLEKKDIWWNVMEYVVCRQGAENVEHNVVEISVEM